VGGCYKYVDLLWVCVVGAINMLICDGYMWVGALNMLICYGYVWVDAINMLNCYWYV